MLQPAPEGNRGRGARAPLGYDPEMFAAEPTRIDDLGKQLVNSGVFDWALEANEDFGLKRVESKHATRLAVLLYHQLRYGCKPDEVHQLMNGKVRPAMEDIQTGDLSLPTKWSLPIIRRIYPAIFDAPMFATQAMPGPLAYAFYLDFVREQDGSDFRYIAPFIAQLSTNYSSGVSTFVLKISAKPNAVGFSKYQFVAGQVLTFGVGTANVENLTISSVTQATGTIVTTANSAKSHSSGDFVLVTTPAALGEAAVPQKGKLSLSRVAVTANKWMMAASWSTEAMEDARAQLAIDVEAEVIQALSIEIGRELFATIISDIVQQATGGNTSIALRGSATANDYRYLALQPIYDAEAVLYSKRFHDTDTLLCGIDLASNISQQDNFHMTPMDSSMMSELGVTHLGDYQGKWKVYKTAFLPPNLGLIFQQPKDWLHAGYVYMPYIPLSPMPLVYAGYNTSTGNYQNTDEWTRNIRTRAGRLMTVTDEYGLITQA